MLEVQRDHPGEVLIRFSETLDLGVAARLSSCLGELPAKTRVVVDFSRVRSFHGVGMAAVAMKLVGLSDLVVRGLGLHHRRLLRYCGVGGTEPKSGSERDE